MPFTELNEQTMEQLKNAIQRALEQGNLFDNDALQEMMERIQNMSSEQIDQLLDRLVQKLIDEGHITVESRPGYGTTFHLYFPAQMSPETLTGPVYDASSLPGGQGQKILLLDDELVLGVMFQRLLTPLNYQVTATNSAREALAWFRENPGRFDLLITDLTMPEMNGLDVARQIHALRPQLPVVLASGYGGSLTDEDLRKAGIVELLQKPVSLPLLAAMIHRLLPAPGPAAKDGQTKLSPS